MSAWETSLSPVTGSVEDDEFDDSDFEEDDELVEDEESVAEWDDDEDDDEDEDYAEYEEFEVDAPRRVHHDHPRQGDWDG